MVHGGTPAVASERHVVRSVQVGTWYTAGRWLWQVSALWCAVSGVNGGTVTVASKHHVVCRLRVGTWYTAGHWLWKAKVLVSSFRVESLMISFQARTWLCGRHGAQWDAGCPRSVPGEWGWNPQQRQE